MSEPRDIDDIFIILDELNERTTCNMVKELSKEISVSNEEALEYIKQWLLHNGENLKF